MDRNKKIVLIILIVLFFVLLLGLFLKNKSNKSFDPQTNDSDVQGSEMFSNFNAQRLAMKEAIIWKSDAKLAYIASDSKISQTGEGNDWTMIFVSKSRQGKGLKVIIKNKEIVSKEEIVFVGQGSDFTSGLISSEEAIAKVKELKGKENIEVLGVEAIYNPEAGIWYWGIKTASSTITVKAQK